MNTYETMNVEGGRPVKMWTRGVPVEEEARGQLANSARLPFIFRHVAAMPDVHLGIGATVGSVIATRGGQTFIELARQDMKRHFVNLPDRQSWMPRRTSWRSCIRSNRSYA